MATRVSLDSMTNRLPYVTARIAGTYEDGTESVGTGFFCKFLIAKGKELQLLVTNKHVIRDTVKTTILIHLGKTNQKGDVEPLPESIAYEIGTKENRWVDHPGDVDLTALPFGPIINHAAKQGNMVFCRTIPHTLIPTEDQLCELTAVEEVVMVGYPTGLWDETNNFPLIRRGTTAFHPYHDFNGKPIGVIDIAAFPGSSGSPVLLFNTGTYRTGSGVKVGDRIMLLGILSSGPVLKANGTISVVDIPTAKVPVVKTDLMIHLGYYIKARELLVLKKHICDLYKLDCEESPKPTAPEGAPPAVTPSA